MSERISVVEISKLFLFHWWRIALAAVAGAVIAYGISVHYIIPTYTSRGSLYVNNNTLQRSQNVNLTDIATSQQLALTCIELLTSDTFLTSVQETSNLPYTAGQIKGMLNLTPMNETEIIEIRVKSHKPEDSQALVNAVLEGAQEEIIRIIQAGNVKVVDAATLPTSPSSPNVVKNVAIGFLAGMLICMLLVFLIDVFDSRIKIEGDLMEVRELPLLGIIPDIDYTRVEEKKNGKK